MRKQRADFDRSILGTVVSRAKRLNILVGLQTCVRPWMRGVHWHHLANTMKWSVRRRWRGLALQTVFSADFPATSAERGRTAYLREGRCVCCTRSCRTFWAGWTGGVRRCPAVVRRACRTSRCAEDRRDMDRPAPLPRPDRRPSRRRRWSTGHVRAAYCRLSTLRCVIQWIVRQ